MYRGGLVCISFFNAFQDFCVFCGHCVCMQCRKLSNCYASFFLLFPFLVAVFRQRSFTNVSRFVAQEAYNQDRTYCVGQTEESAELMFLKVLFATCLTHVMSCALFTVISIHTRKITKLKIWETRWKMTEKVQLFKVQKTEKSIW